MVDRRFFRNKQGPFTLAKLAELGQADVVNADADRLVEDVVPLELAGPNDISFFDNRIYQHQFEVSKAGVCIVNHTVAQKDQSGRAFLTSKDPYLTYARIAQAFYPLEEVGGTIDPRAIVHESAKLGNNVKIAAGAVLESDVELGDGCVIEANAVIGRGVILGNQVTVGANASVSHAIVGDRVVIYPGARIGQPGFGFAPNAGVPVKVPQLGRVIIGNDIEIGANTCVDRGSGHDTVIESGTMIDNQVQIGHNVLIGQGCVIVAQVGISGSTELEPYVQIGGQAGLTGHLTIGRGAKIAAGSGVFRDVPAGLTVCGAPAEPMKEFGRKVIALKKLAMRNGA